MRNLAAKGLATINAPDSCGYDITERGRELLAKHKRRTAKG